MPIPLTVRRRLATEEGFGLFELLFALVLLNIGIFALMGSFQSGALAVSRASSASNGTVVADKVMEVYRGLKNCAIYLHVTGTTGLDTGTPPLPEGIPRPASTWYAAYWGDTAAYANTVNGANQTAYYSFADTTPPTIAPQWVTENTPATGAVLVPCPTLFPGPTGVYPIALNALITSTGIDPTKAVQMVTGPDGQAYPVFSYIVLLQVGGAGWTGGYVKQVTVVVRNPRLTTQPLARESSLFDPKVSP